MKRILALITILPGLSFGLITFTVLIETPSTGAAPAAGGYLQQCLYSLSRTSASFPISGGTGSVNVFTAAECAWTAVSHDSWITVTSGGVGVGNGTVNYSVAANPGAARVGTMTIAGQTFTVSSAAVARVPDPVRELRGLQSITFYERTGGTAPSPFTFAANGPELTERRASPLSAANSDFRGTAVEFYDVFYSDADGALNPNGRYVTVECVFDQQDGALNIAEVNLNFAGGRVEHFNTVVSFLPLGNTGVPATVANAIDGDLQTHTTLGNTVGQSERLRLTLAYLPALSPPPCAYTILPTRAEFYEDADAGAVAIRATSGCNWTAVSNASWITITSGSSGDGTGMVNYAVAANTGFFRAGTLTIAGQTFTVTQEGPCIIDVYPQIQPFLNSGGTGTAGVSDIRSNRNPCAWTATSQADWLTITSGASGLGDGEITYSVAPNPGSRRSGTITVNGKTYTVIQAPACEFAIYHVEGDFSFGPPIIHNSSPILIDRRNAHEKFEVRAPSECGWTAGSAFEWISFGFESGSRESAERTLQGTGNARIHAYFTDNNDALSRRDGDLRIADKVIRVIQPHNGELFFRCLYELAETTRPGERQLAYAFRDGVLARTPRGRAYTKLYYDYSSEAVRIATLNPMLILRSREILERYKPVIRAMVNGEGAVLTKGDLDEIESFMTAFAERGSAGLRDTVRDLCKDLRDPQAHEEFGITIIEGPPRDLPASGLQSLRQAGKVSTLFGLFVGGIFFAAWSRRKGPKALLCVALALAVVNGQWSAVSSQSQSIASRASVSVAAKNAKAMHAPASEAYGKLPLAFEANQGQTDARVKFLARGAGYNLFLTPTEAALRMRNAECGMRMKFVGANPDPEVQGVDPLPMVSNYYTGRDASQWRTGVPTHARVKYTGVYPGIDLVYYGNQGQLEYDFIVAPGADPTAIRLVFEGADDIAIDASGDLVLRAPGGEIRHRKPVVYQEVNGARREIPGRFIFRNPQSAIRNREVGFEIGDYDRSRPLVIDPVLVYSTYLGGGGTDQGIGLVADPAGNVYITGFTSSLNFPTANATQPVSGGQEDAFVFKLNPSGTQVVYATYLGGNGRDNADQMAVDAAGNAYITGMTDSTDFPVMNALQPVSRGDSSAFVAKLSPAGNLLYSTYLGGSATDFGTGIAVDAAGNAYVAGATASPDFPLVNAIQPFMNRAADIYVAKLNTAGNQLIYSTYLGGDGDDIATGIAVDPAGNVYVSGVTTSLDFRTGHAVQAEHGGGLLDAFVAKFSPSGGRLVYSTYLGGRGNDRALRIAADAAGNAYVTGDTDSADFPAAGGAQPAYGGSADAFVTKLNPVGTQLVYSTYLGGSGIDGSTAIALGADGSVYVTGFTNSINFPIADPTPQTFGGGPFDAFVATLNSSGAVLIYSTYLGGSLLDSGFGIAVDTAGNAYVMGVTASTNFPTAAPLQPSNAGGSADVFISKLGFATASGPRITDASVSGKKLFVNGNGFDNGAKILLNGEQQKTANDSQSPATTLIGKKAGKKIAQGQTVTLQVRNPDGALSNEFRYTRPSP